MNFITNFHFSTALPHIYRYKCGKPMLLHIVCRENCRRVGKNSLILCIFAVFFAYFYILSNLFFHISHRLFHKNCCKKGLKMPKFRGFCRSHSRSLSKDFHFAFLLCIFPHFPPIFPHLHYFPSVFNIISYYICTFNSYFFFFKRTFPH